LFNGFETVQLSGKPLPLKFYVPHNFFNFLRDRISCGHGKKRLPDLTTTVARTDSPPFGHFTKYTWQDLLDYLEIKKYLTSIFFIGK